MPKMKDSLAESQALREKFQHDLECMQQDAQRRLVEEKVDSTSDSIML
ncbi:unnamed protein product [Ectocarpus sp. CCAP 1310/34]|nr:unnamed protein product [Ectocarpus sp. CCAP 1310/34]